MSSSSLGVPILLLLVLILFSEVFSCSYCYVTKTHHFLHCMLIRSPHSKLYTPNTTSYTSLLYSSLQNLRFVSSKFSKPQIILTPFNTSEIQAALICCKQHGLQIRVRSGGHDYEGLSSTTSSSSMYSPSFIIIDLVNFKSIAVDLKSETAWVQSGATLGEVYYRISVKSKTLGFPAGICPTVGVGGHFSGGGLGNLVRKYGLAADNIVDAHLVATNGTILNRKSMGEDLFWAIRGGGGVNFGIILSWKIKLVLVPQTVTVFTIHKTLEQGATKLVHKWQQIAAELHENLFIRIIAQISNNENLTIETLFNSLYLGEITELLPLMKKSFPELGLMAKDCTEMSWIESVLYFAGYQNGEPIEILLNRPSQSKSFFKAKSDFLIKPISEIGLEGIWTRFLQENIVYMIVDPLGGIMNKISESEIPFPHRNGNLYSIQYLVKWNEEEEEEEQGTWEAKKHIKWIRKLHRYMTPYVSSSPRSAYINYRDLDLGMNNLGNISYSKSRVWGKKYFRKNFERLALIKQEVDPDNFFSNEQSIPPLHTRRK